ncbi:zinc finger, C2H2 type [Ancylostoma caninum]|uniref:Zinc finger, C2H2 type n=1 Tax=Ancylostoma caninum TaxID=29170 RepID=A0A368FDX3_ANCCA|nr:zinc finger, C2H2 type [Ancylostoma caninum]
MLVAKFTKRISLPISACMELLSGNLLLKRFMYCTACNTILASQSGIDVHSTSKCGADTLVSLYCPPAPINSEVKCPSCSTSVCSISGFRAHMAIQHGIYVEYKAGTHTGVAPESNASLQDIAARVPDTRSAVARDTDNALWLRYGLLQPRSHFDMQLKLAKKYVDCSLYSFAGMVFGSRGIKVIGMDRKENGTPSSSSHGSSRVQRTPVTVKRTAFTLNDSSPPIGMDRRDDASPIPTSALAQGINQHYIKPFVLVNVSQSCYSSSTVFSKPQRKVLRVQNMLRCKFCAHQTSTPQMMRDHLQSNHVLVCRACGNGFAHREALARHGKMGRCSMFFKDASVKQISADCGVCKKRMSLANAYLHLFREHLSAVMYGTVSGQVYPEHLNLHVDTSLADVIALPVKEVMPYSPASNVEAPRDRTNRELVIYKTPKNVICSCYLCGMQMASFEQMGRHLSKHPEKWTRCPFCIDYVPIANHEAMKAHLSQRHMERRDGNWSCRYCQRLLARGSYAHLLYMCTQTRKCALCRGDQCMKNAAEMTVHWTNKHLDILRRFQCSDCGMTFCHVDDFWGHQCRSHFMQQKCSCGFGVVFSSRTAFLLHFGMHIDEANMICKLCNFKFSSRVALQNHRLSHAIMMNGTNGRQMIILDTKLAVPELPGGEEKRPRRSRELDALIEEKRCEFKAVGGLCLVNVDVTLVLRGIVRQVCESLGETYDSSKDSPPPPEHLTGADDDIIEIDSPRVDDDLVGSAEPLTDAQQAALSAEGGEKTVSAPAVVKEVHDDNNDDELQVVAEVEYVPGSSTTTVSAREKKYKCSRCSCTFITAHAAKIHEDTSHNTDAGGICDKVSHA